MTPARAALHRVAACLVIGGALAVFQLAPQQHAWWGLMDDAEPLRWREPGASIALSRVGHVLATQTEVGRFGESERFRPVYYLLRVLEASAWDGDPAWWYRARVALFATTLAAAALALWLFCGPWIMAGGMAFMLSGWYWRDIWTHLGPAEQYASVGTAVLAVGAAMVWRTRAVAAGLWLACLGTIVAAGSKENFAVLIVPLALTAWRARASHPRTAAVTLAAAAAAVAVVGVAIVLGLRGQEGDIYGTPVSLVDRVQWVREAPGALIAMLWAAVLASTIAARRVARQVIAAGEPAPAGADRATAARAIVRDAMLVALVVTALIASQATFYAPTWPTFGSRYDFPGRLVDLLVAVAGAMFAVRWLRGTGRPGTARRVERAAAIGLLAIAARHGMIPVRAAATVNAATTRALHDTLALAVDSSLALDAPIVIEAADDGEIEPVTAVAILLSELGAREPYHFRLRPGGETPRRTAKLDSIARAGYTLADRTIVTPAPPPGGRRAVVVTLRGYQAPSLRYSIPP